jgi:PAS domain S-box-containing protein
MLSAIRCWLSPPVFEGNADKTRRAVLVNAVSLAAAAFVLLLIAGNWLGSGHTPPLVLAIDGGMATLCLILRAWMRRGGVRPAGAGLIALCFVGLTAGVALMGSVRAPATAAYLLVVILAGLLFDQRGLLVAGALSSLAVGGLIVAENAGWLPRPDYAVGVTQWVTYTALFGIAGSLSFYALHAARQALSRADAELAERRRAESQSEAAHQALREAQQMYESVFRLSPEIIVVTTEAEGRHIAVNDAYERVTGYSSDEVIGHTSLELGVWDSLADRERVLQLLREQEVVRNAEVHLRRKSDEPFTALHSVAPVEVGGERCLISVITDITERRQMEEALRLSEARLKSLFELSQKGYATEKELVDHALEEAVRMTGSQIGYFHFVEADEANLELFTWSRRVRETCTAATDRHYPLEAAGVWADCVRLKCPVVHNDYQNLPGRKGYPAGHSPITRHLSVPVFDGDRVVAIAGVGNKEAPYDDADARQLQLFTGEVWRMITHKRAESERERLIGELQAALDNIKTLHGLIPICANCKKIRDDQGYWQDVAVYVRDHSEADFTHGICPDCAKKLYPEFCGNTS